ncbi:glycoside hydrolase family 28 protein [Termitidicoccus mucosus]
MKLAFCRVGAVASRWNWRLRAAAILAIGLVLPTMAAPRSVEIPAWVKDVGARTAPVSENSVIVNTFGAANNGRTLATAAIQKAIDTCAAAGGGTVVFEAGTYLTGALFLKSNIHLRVDAGVTLLAVQDESAYPSRRTRIAGIEMNWPSALINVYGERNVKISGKGIIDGNGEIWWNKFKTMRHDEYEPRGLRWAVDYDCERVRLLVVYDSTDVTIEQVHLRRSGFWTVQICYSHHVTVDGVRITDNTGPSSDGIDIDSSHHVLVQNCDIDCNDDCLCLKAGRDYDGLRVNRPTEYVYIRNNTTRNGHGVISFGSETSGGIRHVVVQGNRAFGTAEGLRFKSAKTRGGFVSDVLILDTVMEDVPVPFVFTLDWYPIYSYVTLPKDLNNLPPNLAGRDKLPEHWHVLQTPVTPPERGFPDFHNITIANATASGARRILTSTGLDTRPIHNIHFINVIASGETAGEIKYGQDWTMQNVKFTTPTGAPLKITNSENVEAPEVTR